MPGRTSPATPSSAAELPYHAESNEHASDAEQPAFHSRDEQACALADAQLLACDDQLSKVACTTILLLEQPAPFDE
jgi:hypothetical protein